jgi:hypothetical protein
MEGTFKEEKEGARPEKKKRTGYLGGNLSFLCIINSCYTGKF